MDIRPRSRHEFSADVLARLVAQDGTARHAYCLSSIERAPDGFVRDAAGFADAAHHLGMLHGKHPGVIDHSANRVVDNAARAWLKHAVEGFGRERTYLNRLVVAVGPLPSTSGHHQSSTIIAQQCHALEMLAQSDRRGCALGAAMALVLDWQPVRAILDAGAVRLGVEPPASQLPSAEETLTLLTELEAEYPIGRAVQFGACQLLGQHRGLWDLLQARAEVRRANPY